MNFDKEEIARTERIDDKLSKTHHHHESNRIIIISYRDWKTVCLRVLWFW